MKEVYNLRFNYTTMSRRKEHNSQKCGDITLRSAEVKNDFGWHDFLFCHGFHYGKHSTVICVHYEDRDGNRHMDDIFPDHPDFNFLEAYVTEI